MISPAAFATLLDDLIRDAGLKGVEVAAATGLRPTSISGWRRGRDLPDASSMRGLLETLRGRLPASSLRLLLRAWMELRFGDTAALAWEEDSPSSRPEDSAAPAMEQLLWRWSPAQLEGLQQLLKQAELHLPVREALLAFSRCLA
jgi:transcriptional regulator with XRE-family HTH domain